MIRAGVTGGIGTGKTTLCKEWEKMGARVVYADDLAKKLMVSDPSVKKKLVHAFGSDTFREDGSLNKPHLIKEAFTHNRVEELNKIVHPAVAAEFMSICEQAEKEGEQMVVEEAALLLNRGRPEGFDVIVLVTLPREKQIERVASRDKTSGEEVISRMENQPDFSSLTHLVDIVIENRGTEKELRDKARKLYKDILKEYDRE
ncbi:dephospho-CoA kinase [Rhodohalobacter mucosus]|uniref:Dephospho-CoA kinase n=1 Tax=Rhodohalobacter mucosus TaxID=2079485 RepID=A0A316TQ98_9BACT|nr:dephospho-CoA kinase [Rhodohalobacter mucosus]PWN06570.1 dephospho-CoA kinase [Rhodohalobacter mucosus]